MANNNNNNNNNSSEQLFDRHQYVQRGRRGRRDRRYVQQRSLYTFICRKIGLISYFNHIKNKRRSMVVSNINLNIRFNNILNPMDHDYSVDQFITNILIYQIESLNRVLRQLKYRGFN